MRLDQDVSLRAHRLRDADRVSGSSIPVRSLHIFDGPLAVVPPSLNHPRIKLEFASDHSFEKSTAVYSPSLG